MAFDEDHCRVRTGHADQNLAVVRHLTLNLLKQERTAKVGIKAKRKNLPQVMAALRNVVLGRLGP